MKRQGIYLLLLALSITRIEASIDGFETVSADPLSHGFFQFGLKTAYYSSMNLYDIPLDGKLLIGPMLYFNVGLANIADFSAHWDAMRKLSNDSQFGDAQEFGDPYFSTKFRLFHGAHVPSFAISFAAKEPAASDDSNLGTDVTGLFFTTHISDRFLSFNYHINLGLGVYGDRTSLARQKDAVMYSGQLEYKLFSNTDVGIEFLGQYHDPQSDLNRGVAKLGFQVGLSARWSVHMVGSFGLISQSEAWGTLLGIEYSKKALK